MEKIIDKVDEAIRARGYKSVILEGKHFDVAAFYKDDTPGTPVYGILLDAKGVNAGIIDSYNGIYTMWFTDKGHCTPDNLSGTTLSDLIGDVLNDFKTDACGNTLPMSVIDRYSASHSLARRARYTHF